MKTMTCDLLHTFVTSDHHFGSSKLLGPFKVFSVEQEDELIAKWNSTVLHFIMIHNVLH